MSQGLPPAPMPAHIDGAEDALALLDSWLAGRGDDWWRGFYDDRAKPCPFFTPAPDESLAGWVQSGRVPPGRALDLGCGQGRNAIFLARHGFQVAGVDFARTALDWAAEQARAAGVSVDWQCRSVFELDIVPASVDLVYDGGCFHHLAPHRRRGYIDRVAAALTPGGRFGMTCFRPEGGSGLSDAEVYERRTLGGGLGYTEERLRALWSGPFEIEELRPMQAQPCGATLFGEAFLWVMLARRR